MYELRIKVRFFSEVQASLSEYKIICLRCSDSYNATQYGEHLKKVKLPEGCRLSAQKQDDLLMLSNKYYEQKELSFFLTNIIKTAS